MTPCSFCGAPWHAATGCRYGSRVVACQACVRAFWAWVERHTRPRRRRRGKGPVGPALDFYGAAALWRREVQEAERRALARRLVEQWGRVPPYRGTLAAAIRLARLTLEEP